MDQVWCVRLYYLYSAFTKRKIINKKTVTRSELDCFFVSGGYLAAGLILTILLRPLKVASSNAAALRL